MDVPGRSQQVLSGRDELFLATKQARAALGGLQVEFLDVNVTVGPDKRSAEPIATDANHQGWGESGLSPLLKSRSSCLLPFDVFADNEQCFISVNDFEDGNDVWVVEL